MNAPFVNTWDDAIERGTTFYRVVKLTQPANPDLPYHPVTNSKPVDLTGLTPRSMLLLRRDGSVAAAFACAVIGDRTEGVIAWAMPRNTVDALTAGQLYEYFIYLDSADGVTTYPAQRGQIAVYRGSAPE